MAGAGGGGSHRNWNVDCKVYIGGLRDDANRYDLEDAFNKYGPVRDVWVARKPPGFAFVEMEDARDAEDACKGLDGTRISGARVKVEMSNGGSKGRGGSRGRSRSPRGRRPSPSRSRSRGRRPARRSPSYRSMSRGRSPSRSPRRQERRPAARRSRSRSRS